MRITGSSHRALLRGCAVLLLWLAGALASTGATPTPAPRGESRAVDVVICLDTSGSMKDLLDATRARIWDVVNELARMKPTPALRVGLLTFGTGAATEREGWIVQHLDLTDDLDAVYAALTSLTIGGSEEYVGRVLDTALDGMRWSRDVDALRVIFVAGNESADQGADSHDFRVAARAARERGIIVNALYAGNREQAVVELWPEVARGGEGNFSAIDPSSGTIQIATPQDERLLELNAKLNTTYVPYGARGQDGLANQIAQDGNASRLGVESCSSRIVAKGGALYSNQSWDLVDAAGAEGFDWDSLQVADLPPELQSMTREQQTAFVDAQRARRESIQAEIQRLSVERETFVRSALTAQAASLGYAMRQAIREQALAKGFTCDGC
jgi:hypothetical protein